MNLFFYGTLLDGQALERVIGVRVASSRLPVATLDGYRRAAIHGTPFPMLVPSPGTKVVGRVLMGVDRASLARLIRYEGPFYDLRRLTVVQANGRRIDASVFMARPGMRASRSDWTLEAWNHNRRRRFGNSSTGRMT